MSATTLPWTIGIYERRPDGTVRTVVAPGYIRFKRKRSAEAQAPHYLRPHQFLTIERAS